MPQFRFEGRTIAAEDGDTVLSALLRNDIAVDYGCRAGACQRCLVCTKPGAAPGPSTKSLDEDLVDRGFFLACQANAAAVSEVELPRESVYPSLRATLASKANLSSSVLRVRLLVPGFKGRRGQCLRLISSTGICRSYSIADFAGDTVELHVRLLPDGAMSTCLVDAGEGDSFTVEGPFGKCCYRVGDSKPIVLIGSGTGLAPLWGVVQDAIRASHPAGISIFHGSATSEGLYFRDELQSLADRGSIQYTPCADEATDARDQAGSPLDLALDRHPDLTGYRVYLCGHPALVKAAQKKCFLAGANLADIHIDSFEDQSGK